MLEKGGDAPFNVIQLSGVLCKPPVLRRTPLGREISDIILAVNRRYGRADYLPCIAWGAVAQQVALALGVIGFVYALRTTRRHQREDAADVEAQESDARDGASYGRRRALPAPRQTHDSDAAYEDAVLDAQGDVPQTPVRPG